MHTNWQTKISLLSANLSAIASTHGQLWSTSGHCIDPFLQNYS